MIIFKEQDEVVQRRYFLKLISKIYLRKTGNTEQAHIIENAIDKSIQNIPFKIQSSSQKMNINLSIEDSYAVIFDLGSAQHVVCILS